ncbi:ABC transporter substrate-binding protein [Marinobacterium sp. YM272]|uniref:ABC transporter substrate-binding protein n=1 Tax=Marinobacterium sp. YM272 TaxID=3421654 RepID=UPI003D7FDA97
MIYIRHCLTWLLMAILVSGCADDKQPLRLGTVVWPGYEPIYLARSQGYLDSEQLRLVELLSTGEVMRGFRNGALDLAALTLDETLLLAQEVDDLQILLVTNTSFGADAVLTRGASSMQALKGRRVGVDSTALGAYFLSRALSKSGMTLADIQPVPLSVDMHEKAFLSGRVDAVVTFEPVRSRLLAAGATEVFSSREIPGEIIDLFVARGEVLSERPEAIKHLIKAWYRGVEFLQKNPAEAQSLMTDRLGLSKEQVAIALQGLRIPGRAEVQDMLYGNEANIGTQAQRVYRIMEEKKLLTEKIDLDRIVAAQSVWD